MSDDVWPTRPSEAYQLGKCPMCLGHGTTHKMSSPDPDALSPCSGCRGAGTLEAFLAVQAEGLPPEAFTDDAYRVGVNPTPELAAAYQRGELPGLPGPALAWCPHGVDLRAPCADCAEADRLPEAWMPPPGLPVTTVDDAFIGPTGDLELPEGVARDPSTGQFVNDQVIGRFPKGTDPLAAIKATMTEFMERTDGTNALPWWAQKRWWHGGPAGFKRGDRLLPPSETGVIPGLESTDKTMVYVTTNRTNALLFAARHDHPVLYEVTNFQGVEPIRDDVIPDETCWRVPSCIVYRTETISRLELRRTMYELLGGVTDTAKAELGIEPPE
jgi:hypothetical protein